MPTLLAADLIERDDRSSTVPTAAKAPATAVIQSVVDDAPTMIVLSTPAGRCEKSEHHAAIASLRRGHGQDATSRDGRFVAYWTHHPSCTLPLCEDQEARSSAAANGMAIATAGRDVAEPPG